MRTGLIGSLLLHAAIMVAGLFVFLPGALEPRTVETALMVNGEPPPPPDELPPPPEEPPPPPEPEEQPQPEEPAPEPPDLEEFVPEDECAIHLESLAPTRLARLRSPLPAPKRLQRAEPAAGAPAPRRKPVVRRKVGPTRDARPVAKRCRSPRYPMTAQRRGLEGRVKLRLRVSAGGGVEKVEVLESSGHTCLDRAAMAAVKEWVFLPALEEGRPVRSWVVQAISFGFRKANA